MNEYRGAQHIFESSDLVIVNGSVIKDRYFAPKTDAAPWVLDRIQNYLAKGSFIYFISYDTDCDLSVIGMHGRLHIGQESNQEVREEVSERPTRHYVN